MRDDSALVHDDETPGVPDYGTPGGVPARVGGPAYGSARPSRTVSDAPVSDSEARPDGGDDGDDEGGFAGFLDAFQDRAQAVLSDLGIGPDDDLPTVSDGVDWSLYPGTRAGDAEFALAALSQEQTIERNEAVLASLRDAITPSFGLSWGLFGEIPRIDPEINDWGGESLLETCTTGVWRSTAKLTNPLVKQQLVELVTRMLAAAGFTDVTLENDPGRASRPVPGDASPLVEAERRLDEIEREFGGRTLRDQPVWRLVAHEKVHSDSRFELTIIDLRLDRTGAFLERARARAALRGGPMNSVDIGIVSRGTLPEVLAGEFRERAERYERRDPPAAG
ncbi:hypothetical protein QCD70_15850 [Agreia sp. PsM10]|uniref:hypothetical protein n=1 Tax=Agreia sp. PsM10 TaxID=3030533 RepID=UPI00263AE138|nr:hypothetical protein [Agreia sp. PsM10]MDN4641725.1 hypothetical protein [Agreia sp. PsM10]